MVVLLLSIIDIIAISLLVYGIYWRRLRKLEAAFQRVEVHQIASQDGLPAQPRRSGRGGVVGVVSAPVAVLAAAKQVATRMGATPHGSSATIDLTPSVIIRHKYYIDLEGSYTKREIQTPTKKRPANVVGSLLEDGMHAPCIDIDLPCELVPSRTPGHFHLYIDKQVPEDLYFAMLEAMAAAGIVEPGYATASRAYGQTFLRLPPPDYTYEKLRKQIEETGSLFGTR